MCCGSRCCGSRRSRRCFGRCRGGCRCRSLRGGRRGTALADAGERRADGDGLVLRDQDLLQHAGERRRDLGVDLVGRDLEQRLVDGDVVAHLLEPAGDGSLGHALAEFGKDHVLAPGSGGRSRRGLRGRSGSRSRSRGLSGGCLGGGCLRGGGLGRGGFSGGCLGGGGLGGVLRRGRLRRGAAVADLREDRADLDRLVLLDQDLFDHTTDRRRDLRVHLVRGDLEQALVRLDRVADLLEPAGDRSLCDALTESGEDHGSAHDDVSFGMDIGSSLVIVGCLSVRARAAACPQVRGTPRRALRSAWGGRGRTARCPRGAPPTPRRADPR